MREKLGGRVIYIGRRTLKYVKSFKYLGMLLFTNDQIFAALVTNKVLEVLEYVRPRDFPYVQR